MSKLSKVAQTIKYCHEMSKIVKIVENCQKMSKNSKMVEIVKKIANMLVRSCFLITLIKCLKVQKSQILLFEVAL